LKSFGLLSAVLAKLPVQNAIIDGEVVCLDAKGRSVVQGIDGEIARLTSARNILTGSNSATHARQNTRKASSRRATKRANRLSPAGRRKLSEMMKKRWAERRKKAAAKTK
jgi:hypothetical protein